MGSTGSSGSIGEMTCSDVKAKACMKLRHGIGNVDPEVVKEYCHVPKLGMGKSKLYKDCLKSEMEPTAWEENWWKTGGRRRRKSRRKTRKKLKKRTRKRTRKKKKRRRRKKRRTKRKKK
jgi:hypothetical protein